jgi:hypothetical protein
VRPQRERQDLTTQQIVPTPRATQAPQSDGVAPRRDRAVGENVRKE